MTNLEIKVDISQARSAINELKKSIDGLDNVNIDGNVFKNLDKDINNTKGAIKQLDNEFKSGKVSVDVYNKTLASLTTQLGSLERAQKSTATGFAKFKNELIDSASQLPIIGSSLGAIASPAGLAVAGIVAVGAGLRSVVSAGAEAEKAFDAIDAVLRPVGASGSELASYLTGFNALKDEIIAVGASSSFSTKEVANLAEELAKSGLSASDVANSLAGVVNLAQTDILGLATTGGILTATLAQFNIATKDASKTADQLATAVNASQIGLGDLSEALKYIGPQAAASGVALDEVLAAIAVLGNSGIKGSLATRALSTSMTNLAKPTKEAQAALDALNVQVFDADGKFKGYKQALTEVGTATQGLTDKQKTAYLAAIFGNEALSEVLVLIKSLTGETANTAAGFDALQQQIINSEGAAAKFAAIRMDNLTGDVEKLSGAWNSFLVSLYGGEGALNNFLRASVQGITGLFDYIASLGGGIDIASSAQKEMEALKTLAEAELATLGAISEETSAKIAEATERNKQYISDSATASTDALQSVSDASSVASDNVSQNMSLASDAIANTSLTAGEFISATLKAIVALGISSFEVLKSTAVVFYNILQTVVKGVVQVFTNVSNNAQNASSNISNFFTEAFRFISINAKIASENLGTLFGDAFRFISDNVQIASNNIAQGFKSAGGKAANFFINGIKGIIAPVNSILTGLGLDTISISLPAIDTSAAYQSFKSFSTSIQGFTDFNLPQAKEIVGTFDGIGDIVRENFLDGASAVLDSADNILDAFKNIKRDQVDVNKEANKKIVQNTADANAKIKALTDSTNKTQTIPTADTTTGGAGGAGGAGGGGSSSSGALKEKLQQDTKVVLDEYKSRLVQIEDEIAKAREDGNITELDRLTKEFTTKEKDLIDIYGSVPKDILDAVKNQELFVETTKEKLKQEKEYLATVKQSGDEAITAYKEYQKTIEATTDAQKKLTDAQNEFNASTKEGLQDLTKDAAELRQDRLLQLAKQLKDVDEQIAEGSTDALLAQRQNIQNLLSQTGSTQEIQKATTEANLTQDEIAQRDYLDKIVSIEEQRRVLALQTADEIKAIQDTLTSDESIKLAQTQLDKIENINKLKEEEAKALQEQLDARKAVETELADIRLDSIDKAYDKDLANAKKIKAIWEEINVLRGSDLSGVVGGAGVFHAGYVPSKNSSSKEYSAILRRNEAVINPSATMRASGLLNAINKGILSDLQFAKIIKQQNSSITNNTSKSINGGVKIVVDSKRSGYDIMDKYIR